MQQVNKTTKPRALVEPFRSLVFIPRIKQRDLPGRTLVHRIANAVVSAVVSDAVVGAAAAGDSFGAYLLGSSHMSKSAFKCVAKQRFFVSFLFQFSTAFQ